MDKQRAALAFVFLGLVSVAGGVVFLLFAQSLGGFSYLGSIASIFLAMLSAAKFAALRRPAPVAVHAPSAPSQRGALHKPAAPRRSAADEEEDAQEAALEARLAALRAAAARPGTPVPGPAHRTGSFAMSDQEPQPDPEPVVSVFQQLEPGLEVTEEPLEPAVAHAFIELRTEPVDALRDVQGAGSLRQMDELRAEIARMREDARLRHGHGVRAKAPVGAEAQPAAPAAQRGSPEQFARTEFTGLHDDAAAREGNAYTRTEFSGLEPAREGASPFARTAYLGPVELKQGGD